MKASDDITKKIPINLHVKMQKFYKLKNHGHLWKRISNSWQRIYVKYVYIIYVCIRDTHICMHLTIQKEKQYQHSKEHAKGHK